MIIIRDSTVLETVPFYELKIGDAFKIPEDSYLRIKIDPSHAFTFSKPTVESIIASKKVASVDLEIIVKNCVPQN